MNPQRLYWGQIFQTVHRILNEYPRQIVVYLAPSISLTHILHYIRLNWLAFARRQGIIGTINYHKLYSQCSSSLNLRCLSLFLCFAPWPCFMMYRISCSYILYCDLIQPKKLEFLSRCRIGRLNIIDKMSKYWKIEGKLTILRA